MGTFLTWLSVMIVGGLISFFVPVLLMGILAIYKKKWWHKRLGPFLQSAVEKTDYGIKAGLLAVTLTLAHCSVSIIYSSSPTFIYNGIALPLMILSGALALIFCMPAFGIKKIKR